MALRDELVYSYAWVSGQGSHELPAYETTEANSRANLQIQHTEAKTKINEIVNAIATDLSSNDNNHIPTVKAVKDALASKANTSDLATVATTGSYNDLTNKPSIPPAITIDSSISSSSTNPVQNKVIKTALDGKANSSHTHTKSQITDFPSIPTVSGTSGYIAKFTGASSVGSAGFRIFVQTSDPGSSSSNGDIWIKYTA